MGGLFIGHKVPDYRENTLVTGREKLEPFTAVLPTAVVAVQEADACTAISKRIEGVETPGLLIYSRTDEGTFAGLLWTIAPDQLRAFGKRFLDLADIFDPQAKQ